MFKYLLPTFLFLFLSFKVGSTQNTSTDIKLQEFNKKYNEIEKLSDELEKNISEIEVLIEKRDSIRAIIPVVIEVDSIAEPVEEKKKFFKRMIEKIKND